MAIASLTASARNESGTGVARKLRESGRVPAIIYGHGRQPQSLSINTREVDKMLSQINAASTVVELAIDGAVSKTLIREIQRHPFKRHIIHIDFQELVAGEKVSVYVPFRFTGTADGVRNSGGILEETMHEVHIRVDPSLIPDHIDVDVTPLTIGHSIHIRELTLPEGVTVLDDTNATICVCTAPKAATEVAPAEGEAAVTTAEPELIRKTKAEEEEEAKSK